MLDGLRNVFMQSLRFCKSKVAYDILVEKWNKECEEVYKYKQSLIAEERAKHQPTADVEEVVRCEKCKYCYINTCPITGLKTYGCQYVAMPFAVKPTHYCGFGERK